MNNTLREDFDLFLAHSGQKISQVAKVTKINVRTLYNWRAGSQQISAAKQKKLRAYMETIPKRQKDYNPPDCES